MSSRETDLADRRDRGRAADAALDADRAGRDRLRDRADRPGPGGLDPEASRRLPNTSGDRVRR
jgi:hypothetical protein